MVGEIRHTDSVPGHTTQRGHWRVRPHVDHHRVIANDEAAEIEQGVVVRAEAQDIILSIWPIVGPAEGTDVRALAVGTGCRLKPNAAHLAVVVVHLLHPLHDPRVADEALCRYRKPRDGRE